jgi:hypothetical protein
MLRGSPRSPTLLTAMENEPKISGVSTDGESVRAGVNRVAAGAVGLTNAALHVDPADEG